MVLLTHALILEGAVKVHLAPSSLTDLITKPQYCATVTMPM